MPMKYDKTNVTSKSLSSRKWWTDRGVGEEWGGQEERVPTLYAKKKCGRWNRQKRWLVHVGGRYYEVVSAFSVVRIHVVASAAKVRYRTLDTISAGEVRIPHLTQQLVSCSIGSSFMYKDMVEINVQNLLLDT